MNKPSHIFISYRHQKPDELIAEQFSKALESAGHEVFIDKDIRWGANWVEKIQEALGKTDYLLLLLSKEAAESVMVVEEVMIAKDLAQQNNGKPIILPIRICYPITQKLPYHLSAYLRTIQQEDWKDERDTSKLIRLLLDILNKGGRWTSGSIESPYVEGINKEIPQPYSDPRNFIIPGGAIDVDSQLYVTRNADELVLNELRKERVMITVCGPRQIGKTSLIMRTYVSVLRSEAKRRAAFLDFQILPNDVFRSQNQIWKTIAHIIAKQLQLDDWNGANWRSEASHDQNFSNFLSQYVFKIDETPLIVCLDEVDKVFSSPIKLDFFASVRAFYNRGAYDATWKKIYWLLSTSTEPSFFIDDLSQSPFNIGLRVTLGEFTSSEVEELTKHFGTSIKKTTIKKILNYTGGHPCLVHLLIYHLTQNPGLFDNIFDGKTAGGGIFREHLYRYLMQFQREKELGEAMKRVINGRGCKDAKLANRLESAGLVRRDLNQILIPFCLLYADFFKYELNR